jgi:hypothetical protein
MERFMRENEGYDREDDWLVSLHSDNDDKLVNYKSKFSFLEVVGFAKLIVATEFARHRNILVYISRGYIRQWQFEFVIRQPEAYYNVCSGIGSKFVSRSSFMLEPDYSGDFTITVGGYLDVDWKTMTLSTFRADVAVTSPQRFIYAGIDDVVQKINRECSGLAWCCTPTPILVFIIQVEIRFSGRAGLRVHFERWTVSQPAGVAASVNKEGRTRFRSNDEHLYESKNFITQFI